MCLFKLEVHSGQKVLYTDSRKHVSKSDISLQFPGRDKGTTQSEVARNLYSSKCGTGKITYQTLPVKLCLCT